MPRARHSTAGKLEQTRAAKEQEKPATPAAHALRVHTAWAVPSARPLPRQTTREEEGESRALCCPRRLRWRRRPLPTGLATGTRCVTPRPPPPALHPARCADAASPETQTARRPDALLAAAGHARGPGDTAVPSRRHHRTQQAVPPTEWFRGGTGAAGPAAAARAEATQVREHASMQEHTRGCTRAHARMSANASTRAHTAAHGARTGTRTHPHTHTEARVAPGPRPAHLSSARCRCSASFSRRFCSSLCCSSSCSFCLSSCRFLMEASLRCLVESKDTFTRNTALSGRPAPATRAQGQSPLPAPRPTQRCPLLEAPTRPPRGLCLH